MGLDIYAGTLTRYYSHNWRRRKMDGAFKKSLRMEELLITRKKCPRLRSRRRWRTGGIKS